MDKFLIPNASNDECKVFFKKMRGDYYRYLAENVGDENSDEARQSLAAYEEATETAKQLPSTHPIRLGLALNFSVFYYEIMKKPDMACKLAREALTDATSALDASDTKHRDSELIVQLLNDNLTVSSNVA